MQYHHATPLSSFALSLLILLAHRLAAARAHCGGSDDCFDGHGAVVEMSEIFVDFCGIF
jgi:hypothetical protein